MIQIRQVSVQDLKIKIDNKEKIRLVDCREPSEHETCRIDGAELIPLSRFQVLAIQKLKPDEEILIHCHHGGRSQKACEYLAGLGYKNVANVSGGIDAWSLRIDPQVPRY